MTNNDGPLVSVAMVTRNVERYLAEAIESVLNQTFRDWELIVVDFGSTDRSKEIIERYTRAEPRLRFHEIPKCSSVASARNAACAMARGRYIAIQDADDVSLPHRLMSEVEFIERHPDVGLVGGEIQRIDEDGNALKTVNNLPTEDQEIRREMAKWNPFWQPTVLMRRDVFAESSGYRELFPSEDYDLWLRISERFKCANLTQILVNYRIHSNQMSFRGRKQQILCSLAARASGSLRREGKPDPLNAGKSFTSALLEEMGVGAEQQQAAIIDGYAFWVKQLFAAEEYSSVGLVAAELLREFRGGRSERLLVADMQILAAKAEWRRGKVISGLLFLCRAARLHPGVLARMSQRFMGRAKRQDLTCRSDAEELS